MTHPAALRAGALGAILGALGLFAASANGAGFSETIRFSSEELHIGNLIGEVRLEGHSGSDFEVTVEAKGADAEPDRLNLRTDDGRIARMFVEFPLDETRKYVYPELGRSSRTQISFGNDYDRNSDDGWMGEVWDMLRGKKIEVRGSGSGMELWTEITVKVPRGKSIRIKNGVGRIYSNDVQANADLDTHSGRVEVADHQGELSIDTGSGSVQIDDARGARINVDTGSGSVRVYDVEGDDVNIDTGSGSVTVDGVRCKDLEVDTGSGGIEAANVHATDISMDTGSGGVDLHVAEMDRGEISIDTGSGGINLRLPRNPSVRVNASTGSGGVQIDLADYELVHKSRNEKRFVIGGGDTRIELETGSGSIRITE